MVLDVLNVRKDDTDWVKCCMDLETEGSRQRGCLRKT